METITQIFSIVFYFFIILIPLVVIHEFGHFLMAILSGVKVKEYGVGIPPRAVYKKWKGVVWSLNWIPLGGFVRIFGDNDALDSAFETAKTDETAARKEYSQLRLEEIMVNKELSFFLEENSLEYDKTWEEFEKNWNNSNNLEKSEEEKYTKKANSLETLIQWEYDNKINSKTAFFNASLAKQILILLGGVGFNVITAFVIFASIFGIIGGTEKVFFPENEDFKNYSQNANLEKVTDNFFVGSITKDGALDKAGVEPGSELVSLDGRSLNDIKSQDEFKSILNQIGDKEVEIEYILADSGEVKNSNIKLQSVEEGGQNSYKIGIASEVYGYKYNLRSKGFFSAFSLAYSETISWIGIIFDGLGQTVSALFTFDKDVLSQLGGPVAISYYGDQIYEASGIVGLLEFIAAISLMLAVFNILPLPALDGGRIVIVILNKIFKKRNRQLEAIVINGTFLILMGLGVVILFSDIGKVFF